LICTNPKYSFTSSTTTYLLTPVLRLFYSAGYSWSEAEEISFGDKYSSILLQLDQKPNHTARFAVVDDDPYLHLFPFEEQAEPGA
jgi:hypothetical protein